ncbi:MAG: CaiB/BaiF CoA transferase family protein, partial [Nitrospinota bacterium]
LAIDMHTEQGQRAIKELAREFDVVLENFRPGTMERWGLDYEELKKQREDIILIRVSGFGQEGPYRRRTSYDTVGAAMGGVFHLTGHPNESPALLGTGMCDYLTAAFNALASLIAVYYRNKTGKGQWADIPQYEAIFRLCEWTAAAYDKLGLVRQRTGNRHPSIAPGDLYRTRDGQWVAIEAINNKIFARLGHAIGRNDLPGDPRFATAARRAEHSEAINGIVAGWAGQKELKEVLDTLSEAQVPAGPVCSPKEIPEDPHVRARKSVIEMDDPVMGELTLQNLVGRFSRTPAEIRDTGVPLGADNEEILREWLHFSREEMAAAVQGERKERPERMAQPASKGGASGEMALSDLRVLELGSGLGGSFAATLLADFGGEVIKVEEPGVGDTLRHLPPFCDEAPLWWAVEGRNKKSITLDLRKEGGRETFLRLAEQSDVVIESFRAGTLERWGLGYEQLSERNPRLVLLRASGFGQEGPYRDRPSGEGVASALGGFTHMTGFLEGTPLRAGYAMAGYSAGIFGAMAVMSALFEQGNSGRGQSIDLALYEPMMRLSHENIPVYRKTGELRERIGNRFNNMLVGLFETRDGKYMAILAPEDKDFARLCRAMGQEELASDPRFSTMVGRKENLEALDRIVTDWAKGYTLEALWEILVKHEVPNHPVFDIQDAFEDPHYRDRGNLVEVADPVMGSVKMQDVVPKLSLTPGSVRNAGPLLGQHNEEVYGSLLGLNEEEMARLSQEG